MSSDVRQPHTRADAHLAPQVVGQHRGLHALDERVRDKVAHQRGQPDPKHHQRRGCVLLCLQYTGARQRHGHRRQQRARQTAEQRRRRAHDKALRFLRARNMDSAIADAVGPEALARLRGARVFMVGCGGIGCELLKNLVLSGVRDIEMVLARAGRLCSFRAALLTPRCRSIWTQLTLAT